MHEFTLNVPQSLETLQLYSRRLPQDIEKAFLQRITQIKVPVTYDTVVHIRNLINQSIVQGVFYSDEKDKTDLLINRAVMELLGEVLEKCQKKLGSTKKKLNITFSLPQALAFSELFGSIPLEIMDNYTGTVIRAIVDEFDKVLS